MKSLVLSTVALAAIVMSATAAQAAVGFGPRHYSYYNGGWNAAHANHSTHHFDLEHRAYHLGLAHQQAHRYPMTNWQHESLHEDLDHDAYHDHLEHRAAHATGAYYPSGYGYYAYPTPYYYRSGFSLYIGR
jgi:hypothetical protein